VLSFKRRKTLYVFFVSSIILLLTASQVLVHYQLKKLESDGELINDAGRMRMLSQRIVQQSFRSIENNAIRKDLCFTVNLFQDHIVRVSNLIDKELLDAEKESFDQAFLLATRISESGNTICNKGTVNNQALFTLELTESAFINAQNKAVALIQGHYESKLSSLSKIETLLAFITVLIILLEVWLIFIPMDKANADKRKKLEKILKIQREISRTVAHDLRSPVSSIASIHHMLKDEIEFKNEDDKELFDAIKLASENALATASSMLVIDQENAIIHSEQKQIDLYALAKAQVRIISANNKYKDRLVIQRRSDYCEVEINIHEVSRMIQNILDNALKYSEDGVFVEIRNNDGFALLSIKDSGIGMTDDLIDWITGKVDENKHKHSTKGFGLGMEFIKRTVKEHRGFIEIEKLTKGTLFTVGFPLVKKNE
jgi:signal transduction histidine kinase